MIYGRLTSDSVNPLSESVNRDPGTYSASSLLSLDIWETRPIKDSGHNHILIFTAIDTISPPTDACMALVFSSVAHLTRRCLVFRQGNMLAQLMLVWGEA